MAASRELRARGAAAEPLEVEHRQIVSEIVSDAIEDPAIHRSRCHPRGFRPVLT